jgi:hypothetical protein
MNDKVTHMCATSLPYTHGNLSVVVPMDDFKLILRQMWKSRATEPKMGELYEKYLELTTFKDDENI